MGIFVHERGIFKMKNILNDLMKQQGIVTEKLSVDTGVSRNTISRLRNDDFDCKISTVTKLAIYFNISVDEFLGMPPTCGAKKAIHEICEVIRRYQNGKF